MGNRRNILSDIKVKEAMRRITIYLPVDASIGQAARCIIKYKVNAVLITDENYDAIGVISKTDLMGAYYAGLDIDGPLSLVMSSPPFFCRPEESLDSALDVMREHGIHRMYVLGEEPNQAIGVLAYPDIVGLLYRYCHKCEFSTIRRKNGDSTFSFADTFKVREVMNPTVQRFKESDSLLRVMEGISVHRRGAVLIESAEGLPAGVVSKTDLILAYKHGLPSSAEARSIMTSPVHRCDQNEQLVAAIRQMIFSDVHRFFVYADRPGNIVGVLSLSDAARARSGSCRACMTSRISLDD